jgi:hypothetical protein
MRYFLFFYFLISTCYAQATSYYFSSTSGNDNNTGTIDAPYSTLAKLNSIHPKPGDKLLLKSGDAFYGAIITNSDGTYSKPIVIDTYGGSKPVVISGTSLLSHWEAIGNGIYASAALTVQSPVRNVIIDNRQVEQGRYPNDYPGTGGYLVYNSYRNNTGSSTIYSSQLAPYGIDSTWIGATLKVKSYLSTLESGNITDVRNSSLTFDNSNMFYQLGYNGCGYFLTNSIKTLDQFGEWYYNTKDKRLYVYFGSDNPNAHRLEVSSVDVLFQPRYSHYRVNNIVFRGANKYGISNTWPGRKNLSLTSVQVLHSGITAIAMANLCRLVIDHCVIDGAATTGINAGYRCDSVEVTNTTINNIGMLMANLYCDSLFQKRMGYGIFSGVSLHKGIHVENVKMNNIAYIGVFFTGSNNIIRRNILTNICLYLDDGGAIYYGNKEVEGKNNLIRRNLIFNCQGYYLGFPIYWPIPNAIFIDDNGSNVTIDSNYVNGSGEAALYIHNAFNCTVEHNTFTNARLALVMMQDDAIGGRVYGNVIRYNDLFVTNSSQRLYCFYSSGNAADNAITQYGTIDYNNLGSPNMLQSGVIGHADTFSFPGVADYAVEDWRMHLPYDWHSIATTINPQNTATYYAVDRDTTIKLSGDWHRLDGTLVDSVLRLKDHTGVLLVR